MSTRVITDMTEIGRFQTTRVVSATKKPIYFAISVLFLSGNVINYTATGALIAG